MKWRWAPVLALGMTAPVVDSGCKHQDEIQMEHGKQPSTVTTRAANTLRAQPPKVAWRARVAGTVIAPPVFAGGLIVVASVSPGNVGSTGAVEAFDAATGAPRWRFDADTGLDGGVAATPVVADNLVVLGTSAGTVHALDAATGRAVWKASIGPSTIAGVAVQSGVVYAVGEGTTLHALDLRTGAAQWEGPAGTGAYAAPAAAGGDVYVASEDGTLRALAAAGGAASWQLALTASMPVAVTPTKELVLVSLLADHSLRAIDRATHGERWTFTATRPAGPAARAPVPAIANGTVAVVDGDRVVGLLLATGAQRWSAAIGATVVPPLAVDDILIAAGGNDVHAIDAAAGTVLWTQHLEQPAISGLCARDGALYFVDGARQLVALVP